MNRSSAWSFEGTVRESARRLIDRLPTLERPLLTARDRYARAHVAVRRLHNRLRYDAPPDPYRFVHVDPASVERGIEFPVAKYRQAGEIAGGDWDRRGFRFEEFDVFRAYRAHFRDGVAWEDTDFYDRIVAQIERGEPRWGCRTEAEFRERFERIERLYERIRTDGYRTQAELLASGDADPAGTGRHSELLTERLKDEIAVHIDRDGGIMFSDGRNRLSIAKLVGLESVPVRVLKRHADWQAVRDAYVRGESWAAEYADHPDVSYLEFDSVR
ncbi:hypothetical protein ACFQRB_18325 [Halobaculum litoreum]|uniref:ParB/Sulfiredoxin domain-containing protein n=1 Tax=Halobaculum litoreum TaxID=3031998 RepID=A0ABD5XW36_9EURY